MSKKKMLLPAIVVAAALVVVLAGAAFAQTATPNTATPQPNGQQAAPSQGTQPPQGGPRMGGMPGLGGMLGGGRQDWTEFDAEASALKLTPTQLFEQLHSGKTLSDIATAQGVDLSTVQQAVQNARTEAEKAAIAQAVKDGRMTQAQADWLLQGIQNGWGGFGGFGGGMGRGMGGHAGPGGQSAPNAPAPTTTPSTGTPS
jgi:hypothetical protein